MFSIFKRLIAPILSGIRISQKKEAFVVHPEIPSVADLMDRISHIADEGSTDDAVISYSLQQDWEKLGGERQFVGNYVKALVAVADALPPEELRCRTSCVALAHTVVDYPYYQVFLEALTPFRKGNHAIDICCQELMSLIKAFGA